MTKEELKQEAEEFVSEKADKGNFDVEKFGKAYFSESSMKQALVKFAEPREKRIAELEAQIEKMKCCYNCSKWYDGECEESPKSKTFFCADFKCDKWEIKEND